MNPSSYQVRRATLDDLGQLTGLWRAMNFPAEELARAVTEFQVAQDADGRLVGAIGLQIAQRQGRIHSESFEDFSLADTLRPMLWERLHAVATNHGLLRLWTHEGAPFWHHCGLRPADKETLPKLPAPWQAESGDWLSLKLKDDLESIISADHEFAMFMASEKERTQRTMQSAKLFRAVATMIGITVAILAIGAAVYLVQKNPNLFHH